MVMNNHLIPYSLELAYWFCKKATSVGKQLGEQQIQHLLFLAQVHYILKSGHFLYPSLFVCGRSGFYNPTIRTLMEFGLPLMPETNFDAKIETFLELIWQKYALLSDTELTNFILTLDCWKKNYRSNEEFIVNPMHLIDSFADALHLSKEQKKTKTKIMLSQHGPVKVSAWQPRKLSSSN